MTPSRSINSYRCIEEDQILKIGLVVDSTSASAEIFKLAKWCQDYGTLNISHLVLAGEPLDWISSVVGKFRARVFTWMVKLETVMIRSRNHHAVTGKHDLRSLIPKIVLVESTATATECACSGDGWKEIKALQLDLLLITGSGVLPLGICDMAKLGALRISYGHGGPVGFWEVFFKRDYTGFSIRHLSTDPDSSIDLVSGKIATRYCYSLNKLHIEQKCMYYAKKILGSILLNREMPEPGHSLPLIESRRAMPGLFVQATYLMQLGIRQLKRTIRSKFQLDFKWSVAFQKRGWCDADMSSAVKIPRPHQHFLADPFVVSENGRDYCFLEDYDYSTNKGHVAVYELLNDSAVCLGNALIEPFHLSFPYLFRYQSELYMCPETSRNRQIRVYKCMHFPMQWQLHTVLMDDVSAADTMLFEHGERWWMLTNIDVSGSGDYCTELCIYWAESPLSKNWKAHSLNPVFIDAKKGRNAGLLFDANHIYRVAQKQGFERYGKAFSINRIDQLDENSYLETEVRSVQANFFPNINGTHHMHSSGKITVFDFI